MRSVGFKNVGLIGVIACLSLGIIGQVDAAWFQASGQAVIINGDKQLARQQATQEAIKQALLFAGASVTSVQQLTNGLLKDDRFEVRASGEVNRIELIDEIYHDDFITVSIRADVFPQTAKCSASDYKKTIVTAHMPFETPMQTQDGNLFALGQSAIEQLPQMFELMAPHSMITAVVPNTFNWSAPMVQRQVHHLAQQHDAQYVLSVTATDVSVHRPNASLAFWRDTTPVRNFTVRVRLFDGMTSALLLDFKVGNQATWHASKFEQLDVHSNYFWQTPYGLAVEITLQRIVQDVDEALSCKRAIGRVLQIANNQLQINLGGQQQVKRGDTLTVYQTRELIDSFGQGYRQHVLHPTAVIVSDVYANTATVTSVDGSLLGDIQPNDFVVKQ
jgi:hypothetical protein